MASEVRFVLVHRDPKFRERVAAACQVPGLFAHTFAIAGTALALARDLSPHCIISEVRPLDMGAEQFLRELRGRYGVEAPFITVAPANAEASAKAMLDAGADGYLLEPFSIPELLTKIRSVLKPAGAGPTAKPRPASPDSPPLGSAAVAPLEHAAVPSKVNAVKPTATTRQELWPEAAPGLGRFTQIDLSGRSLVVLTEAVLRPRFIVTTVITEKGSAIRKIQTELAHALSRAEDGPIVREQIDRQHGSVLEVIDQLIVTARKRRAIWPRGQDEQGATRTGTRN